MTARTNTPHHQADRQPGQSSDIWGSATDAVVLHLADWRQAAVIADLLHAGAAAIAYYPLARTAAVEHNSRRQHAELGHEVANALVHEAERIAERARSGKLRRPAPPTPDEQENTP